MGTKENRGEARERIGGYTQVMGEKVNYGDEGRREGRVVQEQVMGVWEGRLSEGKRGKGRSCRRWVKGR